MKTSLIIAGLFSVLFLGSCSNAAYLPRPEEIDVNRYGSFITVFRTTGKNVRGELIAADSSKLVVLDKVKKTIVPTIIPVKEMKNFELTYAQPKNYGWTIPVFTLVTIAHGWWLMITMPVNFLVTLWVSINHGFSR